MRALLQRVHSARVTVNSEVIGEIKEGWLAFIGVSPIDDPNDLEYIAQKIANLRAFNDSDGKMNLSVLDTSGSILAVSQFTLYGDCRKGRRPSFSQAAPPDQAEKGYEALVAELRSMGIEVQTGRFGADMNVELINDGPVTFLLDSKKEF